ncbi:hypothetical protein KVT40_006305 [Elsinoe batatas]|uniref:Uncharacterized protein n=1 Tax=Elsinoe batatas TaxID=2601811 RepID=A0A8K0PHS7_9PEZI|nr:hypothetical protein KVT40_006305 [Elsinoe batatas]
MLADIFLRLVPFPQIQDTTLVMFEVPSAKRVRREELEESASSRHSSPDDDALETFRAVHLDYEIVQQHDNSQPTQQAQEDEEEAEFNLFSRPSNGAASQPSKITLRSPTPDAAGGIIVRERPSTYYFTGPISAELAREYRIAAISGEVIRQWSHTPWAGSRYEWKVVTFPPNRRKIDNTGMSGQNEQRRVGTTRKRLGKKGRIKRRKTLATKALQQEAEKAAKEVKERADREKKAKKNRNKKFKKRARDKQKKQGLEGTVTAGNAAGSGNESGENET